MLIDFTSIKRRQNVHTRIARPKRATKKKKRKTTPQAAVVRQPQTNIAERLRAKLTECNELRENKK